MDPQLLAAMYARSAKLLLANLEGVTDEQALWQPSPDVNNINWLVGHLVNGRCRIGIMLGVEPVWDADTREVYKNGAARLMADSAGIVPLSRAITDFAFISEATGAALQALAPDALLAPADDARFTSRAEHFLYMHFHEAHHAGQVMLLREQLGMPSTWPF